MKLSSIIELIIVGSVLLVLASALMGDSNDDKEPIIFDHNKHITENDMSCEDCHGGVGMGQASQRFMPDHETCEGCHDVEEDSSCKTCHLNPDNPVGMSPAGANYAAFAHAPHSSVTCAECHSQITADNIHPTIPKMADCQACHQDHAAPTSCEECHQGQRPTPMDHHLVSWAQDHGFEASGGTSDCASCHEQSSCDECHQGVNLFGNPHPPTWRFNHFSESAFGSDCMSCHETRESCTACHKMMVQRPHELGPGYANQIDGGAHKMEAEAFIEACLSCHDVGNADPTCAKCHD